MIAAGGEDEFVRLYDLATGKLLDERAAHHDWVRSVAFGRSGLLASGSGDRSVQLWDTAEGRLTPVQRIDDLGARVRAVALPDGDVVVAATEDATLHVCTGARAASSVGMPPGVDWVRGVGCLADGTVIAACEDGGLRRWNRASGLQTISEGENTVWSTQFAADGHLAVIGDAVGTLQVFEAPTNNRRRLLSAGRGRVWSLAANSARIAAAGGDGTVRVWLFDGGEPALFNEDAERSWAVAMPRTTDLLAVSTGNGHIRCWDLGGGTSQLLWEQDVRAGRLRSLAFDDTGELLAVCGGDGTVRVWQARTGQHASRFTSSGGWARTVALDGPGDRAAVGAGTGEIAVRSLREDRFTAHLAGHNGRILMLGFAAGDKLVSAAADGTVRLWSLAEQRQLAEVRVDATLHCAAFDPATSRILAGSAAGVVALSLNSD
ncbi:hypothetical protein GCM10020367_08310 [Streptomyces sannanensis]|uniref:Anaphase-promoting complex subunit 4-like WD40 domain-containing protein n=1 Tax=Streptomyces sannanensis TaxID=285536 RepID=A0ABP6S5R2_9ACTN